MPTPDTIRIQLAGSPDKGIWCQKFFLLFTPLASRRKWWPLIKEITITLGPLFDGITIKPEHEQNLPIEWQAESTPEEPGEALQAITPRLEEWFRNVADEN